MLRCSEPADIIAALLEFSSRVAWISFVAWNQLASRRVFGSNLIELVEDRAGRAQNRGSELLGRCFSMSLTSNIRLTRNR